MGLRKGDVRYGAERPKVQEWREECLGVWESCQSRWTRAVADYHTEEPPDRRVFSIRTKMDGEGELVFGERTNNRERK